MLTAARLTATLRWSVRKKNKKKQASLSCWSPLLLIHEAVIWTKNTTDGLMWRRTCVLTLRYTAYKNTAQLGQIQDPMSKRWDRANTCQHYRLCSRRFLLCSACKLCVCLWSSAREPEQKGRGTPFPHLYSFHCIAHNYENTRFKRT